ncbi:MAG: DNA polymerase III subunit [Aquificota bacterium]|nr:DNA polymerase III subunit [Aquificota bacterium]
MNCFTERARFRSSLLFYGPSGVGKSTAALDFAKGLLCLEETPWGCGECASCRHVERFIEDVVSGSWEGLSVYEEVGGKNVFVYLMGEHPDLIYVPPSGTGIRIDQVRALKEFSYIRPALSRRKVALIDDAHRLTKESGNALLKVLEEPPLDTILILISEGKENLLPTILSRTFQVEFPPLEEGTFYELLGREDREIYDLSGGASPLRRTS